MTFDEAVAAMAAMDTPVDRVIAVLPDGIEGSRAHYILIVSREDRYIATRLSAHTLTADMLNRELDTQYRRLTTTPHTLDALRDDLPISSKALRWLVFDVDSFVLWHNRRLRCDG